MNYGVISSAEDVGGGGGGLSQTNRVTPPAAPEKPATSLQTFKKRRKRIDDSSSSSSSDNDDDDDERQEEKAEANGRLKKKRKKDTTAVPNGASSVPTATAVLLQALPIVTEHKFRLATQVDQLVTQIQHDVRLDKLHLGAKLEMELRFGTLIYLATGKRVDPGVMGMQIMRPETMACTRFDTNVDVFCFDTVGKALDRLVGMTCADIVAHKARYIERSEYTQEVCKYKDGVRALVSGDGKRKQQPRVEYQVKRPIVCYNISLAGEQGYRVDMRLAFNEEWSLANASQESDQKLLPTHPEKWQEKRQKMVQSYQIGTWSFENAQTSLQQSGKKDVVTTRQSEIDWTSEPNSHGATTHWERVVPECLQLGLVMARHL